MKFTKIRLKGLQTIDLPIVGVLPTDDFILKDVDGLGPPETDVSVGRDLTGFGTFQRRRPQGREITLKVALNPSWHLDQTPASLRTRLYGLLTPGFSDVIKVEIMDGAQVVAVTDGVVKRIDPVMFSKDPEVLITIPCIQPYLSHPSFISLTNLDKAFPQITNIGTAPTGFFMSLTFTNPAGQLVIWKLDESGQQSTHMSITAPFLTNDIINFNTIAGQRKITVIRGSDVVNMVGALHTASVWHQLSGGVNTFATNGQNFTWGSVYYTPQYWGV